MAPLATRPLGRSGIDVSVLGFGSAPLGDLYTHVDDVTAIETALAAFAGGMTLFDSSPLYGHGLAEHRCGTALRRVGRDNVVMSTKVGRRMDPFQPRRGESRFFGGLPHRSVFDYSYDGAMRSLEQSLLRLGTDRIDVLLIHDVDFWTHGDGVEQRFAEAMEGSYRALDRLRADGTVRAIGIGVNEAEMCVRFAGAGDFDTMLLAGRYSLLEQPALAEFLPLAERRGIGVMLGGVFNSGILATGAVAGARYNYREAPPEIMERVRRIEAVCAAHDVPLPVAAMHFALGHPAIASLVIGAVAPDEVQRNLVSFATPVPPSLWSDLKQAGLLAPDAPVPA